MDQLSEQILKTEYSEEFDQKRKNRMVVGKYEYGTVQENVASGKTDAIQSAENCVTLYRKTGNKKYLVDGANFFMMEYMYPVHPNIHEEYRDSPQSATERMEE